MRFAQSGPFTRRLVTALAALVIFAAVPAAGAAPAAQWKEFRSPEGGFVVLLPGEPTLDRKATPTDFGQIDMHMYTVTTANMYCSVAFYDVPAGLNKPVDTLLDDTCNGFVKGANLTEKAERRAIALGSHPGREIIGESPDGAFLLMARYYLVGKRIYLVMVGTAIAEASSPEVGRYLDSFRLVRG
jgi:hypothetical protein